MFYESAIRQCSLGYPGQSVHCLELSYGRNERVIFLFRHLTPQLQSPEPSPCCINSSILQLGQVYTGQTGVYRELQAGLVLHRCVHKTNHRPLYLASESRVSLPIHTPDFLRNKRHCPALLCVWGYCPYPTITACSFYAYLLL